MPRVHERRRHDRALLTYPAALRDKAGRMLFRGRSSDVSPCGIRVIGPDRATLREGQPVWVELSVPNVRRTGPKTRTVKLQGEVRRTMGMGEWQGVVVIFSTDFSATMLTPVG